MPCLAYSFETVYHIELSVDHELYRVDLQTKKKEYKDLSKETKSMKAKVNKLEKKVSYQRNILQHGQYSHFSNNVRAAFQESSCYIIYIIFIKLYKKNFPQEITVIRRVVLCTIASR